jgi:hypothetical protein
VQELLTSLYVWAIAVAGAIGSPSAQVDPADQAGRALRLSGCVVRGQDGRGFLLTNISQAASQPSKEIAIEPGPVGTAGSSPAIFYWLADNGALTNEVGHQVEIEGRLAGAPVPGEMEIHRTANRTDLAIASGRDALRAQLPESMFALSPPAPLTVDPITGTTTVSVVVGRVDVTDVRELARTCE